MQLVLSLFPGIDMMGSGFEQAGFCVVRGPDPIFGGDIRSFSPPSDRFDGVIGGPPCQDFSRVRRTAPTGQGLEMLGEFCRVVGEASPSWFLMENVPSVPDVAVEGYTVQRFDVDPRHVGMKQSRLRHFQFGYRDSAAVVLLRAVTFLTGESACLASEGARKNRRSWGDFCELQGLPRDFSLPGMTIEARYRAVGNGVPPPVAAFIARAIRNRHEFLNVRVCICGCARPVWGRQSAATPACRKRMSRRSSCTAIPKCGFADSEMHTTIAAIRENPG